MWQVSNVYVICSFAAIGKAPEPLICCPPSRFLWVSCDFGVRRAGGTAGHPVELIAWHRRAGGWRVVIRPSSWAADPPPATVAGHATANPLAREMFRRGGGERDQDAGRPRTTVEATGMVRRSIDSLTDDVLGGALFGFDISSMSGVLGTQAYLRYFNQPFSYRQGGITCAMPAGSIVGSLGSSFIADKFSRKVAIQVSSLIWIVGSM